MKPFNLEAAKSGAPIVTRDGREARFIAHVPEANEVERIVALIGKSLFWYSENGSYLLDTESNRDLFMKPQKRTIWVHLYADGSARWHEEHSMLVPSPQILIKSALIKTFSIEIEE